MDIFLSQRSTIADIAEFDVKGPWETKSNAELRVLLALPYTDLLNYLKYDENQLENIPEDIRGLRMYHLRGLEKGSIGGGEFHKVRKEIIFGLEGALSLELEDLYGDKKSLLLNSHKGVYVPPFVLHTYHVEEKGSEIIVLANTLFNPNDPETHDTFSKEMFKELQKKS